MSALPPRHAGVWAAAWLVLLLAGAVPARAGTAESDLHPEIRYYTSVLLDKPVAYWRLGDYATQTAADYTGNGHHALYRGHVLLSQLPALVADANPSVWLNGTDGWIAAPSLSLEDQFTIEIWASPARFAPAPPRSRVVIADTRRRGLFWRPSDGRLLVRFGSEFTSARQVASNSWHHIVYTFDGARERLYVDGRAAGSRRSRGVTWAAPFGIGGMLGRSAPFWKGFLDEVAVYPRALTITQVRSHYVASFRGARAARAPWQKGLLYVFCAALVAYVFRPWWWVGLVWGAICLLGLLRDANDRTFLVVAVGFLGLAALARGARRVTRQWRGQAEPTR